ncbi:MAG: S8 family serine peptidase, partial [Candidatus Bathyarchaeia archaeon]
MRATHFAVLAVIAILIVGALVPTTSANDSTPTSQATDRGLPIKPAAQQPENLEKTLDHLLTRAFDRGDESIRILARYDAEFDGVLPPNLTVHRRFHLVPYISLEGKPEDVRALANVPGIRGVYPDVKFELTWIRSQDLPLQPQQTFEAGKEYPYLGRFPTLLNETTNLIAAQKLWNQNITGRGVVIAILDTGINTHHPTLNDVDDDPETEDPKVIAEVNFTSDEEAGGDLLGHGTMVAAIAAGTGAAGSRGFLSSFTGQFHNATILPGTQRGVAPDARLLSVKVVSSEGFGFLSWIIAGVEWSVDNGADVMNLSLGGAVIETSDPLVEAVQKAVDAGVVVVTSAGNNGPGHFSISTPGHASKVISVGLVYKTGNLTYFSSRGPTPFSLNFKPDVVAPGSEVLSANTFFEQFEDAMYITGWGTSFSSPHVAGAVALLLQDFPGATPYAVKAALINGAEDLGYGPADQGAGLINVANAYELMKSAQLRGEGIQLPEATIGGQSPPELAGVKVLFTGDAGNFSRFMDLLLEEGANVTVGGVFAENKTLTFNAPTLEDSPRTFVDREIHGNIKQFSVSVSGVFDDYIDRFLVEYVDKNGNRHTVVDRSGDLGSFQSHHSDIVEAQSVRVLVSEFDAASNPAGFPVYLTLKLQPVDPRESHVWLLVQLTNEKQFGLTAKEAREAVSEGATSLLVIGDQLASQYSKLTDAFDIKWNPLGVASGGASSKLESHPATREVGQVFFGGPLTSLKPLGNNTKVLVYDPIYPGVAVWTAASTKAIVAAISDDDVLNNRYLEAAHNQRLGLNLIRWLADAVRQQDPAREISLALTHPLHVPNATQATFTATVTNHGAKEETVNVSFNILSPSNKTVFERTFTLSVPNNKSRLSTMNVTGLTLEEKQFETFRVEAEASLDAGVEEIDVSNNSVSSTFTVLAKNPRIGGTPVLTTMTPNHVTSFTGPYIALFPGDFNVFNLTITSSGALNISRLVIEGNVSRLASFTSAEILSQHGTLQLDSEVFLEHLPYAFIHKPENSIGATWELKNFTDESFAPIQIIIPSKATFGKYAGRIALYNGTDEVHSIPMALEVRQPKAKVLYDDVFDTFSPSLQAYFDAERLWGGIDVVFPSLDVWPWWVEMSKQGFDVDSLAQIIFDARSGELAATHAQYPQKQPRPPYGRASEDVWSFLLRARELGYSAVVVHDKEMHSMETAAWPKLMNSGVSLITHFDSDFPNLFTASPPQLFAEKNVGFGLIRHFNATNPVGRGVQNATFLGGVTLAVPAGVEVLATVADLQGGAPQSGVIAAMIRSSSGSKQIAIGDSNMFEYMDSPDLPWAVYFLSFNITVTNQQAAQLAEREMAYAVNRPPRLEVVTDQDEYEAGARITVKVHVDKPAQARLELRGVEGNIVDTAETRLASPTSTVTLSLPSNGPWGPYTVEAVAVDEMDEASSAFAVVTMVDKQPPQLSIVYPRSGLDFDAGAVTATWESSDVGRGIRTHLVRVDDGPWIDIGPYQAYVATGLQHGSHTLAVRVVDEAGLTSEDSVSFTVGVKLEEEKARLAEEAAKRAEEVRELAR